MLLQQCLQCRHVIVVDGNDWHSKSLFKLGIFLWFMVSFQDQKKWKDNKVFKVLYLSQEDNGLMLALGNELFSNGQTLVCNIRLLRPR